MQQPILVIMAAGMGSRYGGLKQLDPVGPNGQIILEYSLFDAARAGFSRAVFIIRPEMQALFEETIGARASAHMEISYAYQTPQTLPDGCALPADREKPLGTAHAVYCAKQAVGDAPFAVINADDFYGAQAFAEMYTYLSQAADDDLFRYAMVGYCVENTLSASGTVSRGVCTTDEQGMLCEIIERTQIARQDDGVIRDGALVLPEGTKVSMNFWGFTASFPRVLEDLLRTFVTQQLPENPQKAEFYLPFAVDALLRAQRATVRVLPTHGQWFGVTYREDKPEVMQSIAALTAQGAYPAQW